MRLDIHQDSAVITGNFNDDKQVWNAVLEAAHDAGLTVLGTLSHEFYPQGFSGIILLAESHVAIHTFPENNEAWVYVATCGEVGNDKLTKFMATITSTWEVKHETS